MIVRDFRRLGILCPDADPDYITPVVQRDIEGRLCKHSPENAG